MIFRIMILRIFQLGFSRVFKLITDVTQIVKVREISN